MFGLARGYATEHDHARSQQAHAVGGVGEEAVYAGAPDGSGGALAFRAGTSAATVTGSVSEETLVSLARLAAGRL
jgi:hypothetical protein